VLLTNNRKKVLTDPRSLSKSKSPSSSGNRWYTGADDEADVASSMWYGGGGGVGHSHQTTANELSPPLISHDDASSSSVSKTEFY